MNGELDSGEVSRLLLGAEQSEMGRTVNEVSREKLDLPCPEVGRQSPKTRRVISKSTCTVLPCTSKNSGICTQTKLSQVISGPDSLDR